MLRISKLTDYGVILVAELARLKESECASVPQLTEATALPAPTVSKVLKHLTRVGLVRSYRGVRGGYRLAKQPRELRLIDIVSVFEGPLSITECATPKNVPCEHHRECSVRRQWERINEFMYDTLAAITLEDMLKTDEDLLVRLQITGPKLPKLRPMFRPSDPQVEAQIRAK